MFSHLLASACFLSIALSLSNLDPHSFQYRDLYAARHHNDLHHRTNNIEAKRSIVLTYAEVLDSNADNARLASRVRLGGDSPALLVEEFDHLLSLVECSGSTLTLTFREEVIYNKAKKACSDIIAGYVITSHSSCGNAGEHSVYKVLSIQNDDHNNTFSLLVEETSFRQAFPSTKLEFGQTTESHIFHRHDRLARRQKDVISAATTLVPSATPTAESIRFDLSNDQTDTNFAWPNGVPGAPKIPLTVGCKKCTTKGQLILTQGEIEFTSTSTLLDQLFDDDVEMDFIKSGFFQLELNGFESSILLKATPSASLSFAYDLFTLPVMGLRIPKIGAAGVLFRPQIVFDIGVQGAIELNWGFKVNVPDKSTIRLDVGEFNKSGVTGFDRTKVEVLPFNANTSDINFTLKTGLRSFLPLGISAMSDKVQLLGGPYLDLPTINTTISQLATSNVNENCETGKGQQSVKFKNAFQNLTHITSNMGMGVGFAFEARLGRKKNNYAYDIWNKTAPLPTSCFAFDKDKGMLPATAAAKSINSASTLWKRSSERQNIFGVFVVAWVKILLEKRKLEGDMTL
ncbi:hypothetical protein B0J11DRAFT_576735 [Dendryphion nanum]|uniref:Gpi anchored protein n=1 Tax=Dendryphion nanum TaxID=256645 RepID=A0A9P9ISL3_9PLEO|nr:hypothetical protein B0J11DRAFT_576735 [Dendryphion nanum]